MPTYRTPGVYVEEISTFPPSVAEVSTAIPAFIGYTEKDPTPEEAKVTPSIARIATMLEYETFFGGPKPSDFTVTTEENPDTSRREVKTVERKKPTAEFLLYYCVSLYFKNGGGPCYVVSVGNYGSTPNKEDFGKGLDELEKEDEPTLIVLTDAVNLSSAGDYYELCGKALQQCNKLGDRFSLLDVVNGDDAGFRNDSNLNGPEYLMYGAAYHPYLQTSLSYQYDEKNVTLGGGTSSQDEADNDPQGSTLVDIKQSETGLYNQIKAALNQQRVILPPSAAVAGIYAQVDRDRGVWKAPANVGVSAVIGPVTKITHADQESLNIDPTAGKSINAIRAFTGKGTLVWGARTLAGNDNEWRYVSVRRLFNMIEESIRKATAFAVFEPNDATTWLKVKAMIESYLYGLWEQGALAGPTPAAAYFVNVGLGKTMTPQDVLEGRMIVEVGVAAVRPAEFIILRFTHKMQEA